jgi:hypothetical protein
MIESINAWSPIYNIMVFSILLDKLDDSCDSVSFDPAFYNNDNIHNLHISKHIMMKFRNLLLIALSLLFKSCFLKSQIIYSFEKNKGIYEFQATDTDTVKHEVNFWTMEVSPWKNEPLPINFIFSEAPPNAEKLKSISTSLFARDEKGNFNPLPSKSELKIEYWDGKDRVTLNKENNQTPLNKLIDWEKVNYKYEFLNVEYTKKDNPVTYTYFYKFETKDYPDTLKLIVDFLWENGERKYETFMFKEKYEGPKLNLKY